MVFHWAPPIANNLLIKKQGEKQYIEVGDPECYFIDEDGQELYKTIENVLLVQIENGKVIFVKDN